MKRKHSQVNPRAHNQTLSVGRNSFIFSPFCIIFSLICFTASFNNYLSLSTPRAVYWKVCNWNEEAILSGKIKSSIYPQSKLRTSVPILGGFNGNDPIVWGHGGKWCGWAEKQDWVEAQARWAGSISMQLYVYICQMFIWALLRNVFHFLMPCLQGGLRMSFQNSVWDFFLALWLVVPSILNLLSLGSVARGLLGFERNNLVELTEHWNLKIKILLRMRMRINNKNEGNGTNVCNAGGKYIDKWLIMGVA